jgi:pyrroloquinoline-quinone synthase
MTVEMRRLEEVARKYDLLRHSFYQRWAAGELSRDELDDYAGQYAHVVAGLPRWLSAAADAESENGRLLRAHALEESNHLALWDAFAKALNPSRDAALDPANPATCELLRRCDALAASGQGMAVAWAFEAQSPQVSETKLEGLRAHYGIDADSGGQYFAIHARRDVDHRQELAAMIETSPDGDAPVAAADAALAALWDVLTSVEKVAGTA